MLHQDKDKNKDEPVTIWAPNEPVAKKLKEEKQPDKKAEAKSEAKVLEIEDVIASEKGAKVEFRLTHGSSTGSTEDKLERYENDAKMTPGKKYGGDINIDHANTKNFQLIHSTLANNEVSYKEEDKRRNQKKLRFKMRMDFYDSPQLEKNKVPVIGAKGYIGYLQEMVPETNPCMLMRFESNPFNMSRKDVLRLTEGNPAYIVYKNEKNEEKIGYVTENGLLVKLKGQLVLSLIKPLFPSTDEEIITANAEKLAMIKSASGHSPHKDCFPLADILEFEKLEEISKRFRQELAALPERSVPKIRELIRNRFPEIVDYYDVKRSRAQDHQTLRSRNPENQKIFMYTNSLKHTDLNRNHLNPAISSQNESDYRMMYRAYGGQILKEALQLLLLRESAEFFNNQMPDNFEDLRDRVNRDPGLRSKMIAKFSNSIRDLDSCAFSSSDDLQALADNFNELFDPNSKLLNELETYTCTSELSQSHGPFTYLKNDNKLQEIYQKLMDKSAKFPQLRESDLHRLFSIVNRPEFQERVNAHLSNPFKDAYNQLVATITDPSPEELKKPEGERRKSGLEAEYQRAFHKAPNILLSCMNLEPANKAKKTVCPATEGFAFLRDSSDNIFSAKALEKIQIDDIFAHIMHAHLLDPTFTIDFGFVELKGQKKKEAAVREALSIINNFVVNPTNEQRDAYYQLMAEWQKYLPAVNHLVVQENLIEPGKPNQDTYQADNLLITMANLEILKEVRQRGYQISVPEPEEMAIPAVRTAVLESKDEAPRQQVVSESKGEAAPRNRSVSPSQRGLFGVTVAAAVAAAQQQEQAAAVTEAATASAVRPGGSSGDNR
ncbi:MAG TPA: hypothetical protein VLI69_07130 [Gammaproteobacteria bacterium]|nr:hypothetical protein [Gammaproteobacteria bacterium]